MSLPTQSRHSLSPAAAPLLQMRQVSKSFPGVKALDGVTFTVRSGEIHALMGENGAGKSTLIKVLTGVYRRDTGEILFEGNSINPHSPQEAQTLGISTVYQEVNLIPQLSVAENICLGRQPARGGCISWRQIHDRAGKALARLGLHIDVTEILSNCSIAIQQLVAIARALDIEARLLILDEPTSSLDEGEVARLFSIMRQIKAEGIGIVFVTHFLDQVYGVSDRITVLRNGRFVGEYEAAQLPRLKLVSAMMGKEVSELDFQASSRVAAERSDTPLLKLKQLGRKGSVREVDLDVFAGEVLGLAGLLGSGRTELARLVFGLDTPDEGELFLEGRPITPRSPRQAMDLKFGFCPEDRKTEAIVPDLSVRENIILALQAGRGWFRFLSHAKQTGVADNFIKALNIITPHREQPVRLLSGGNQQKVILARWLASHPRLLILDEPTRGIDVGAKLEIEKLMLRLTSEGMAILFISSDLEEIVRSSHRVAVLRDRRKVAELGGDQITENNIMHAIAAPAATLPGNHGCAL